MRQIYRLLLAMSTSLLMLSACGSGMNLESNKTEETIVTTAMPEAATEETTDEPENEEESKEISEKIGEAVEPTEVEASTELEDNEAAENNGATAPGEADTDQANLTALELATVETLANVLDLDIEEYTYLFTHKEDYIEIEVRESTTDGQAHAPLEGIYRYYPQTQEIFVSDYLTGDFILYEEYQELQNN